MVRTTKPVPRKVRLLNLREHPSIHWPPGIEPNPAWAGPVRETADPFRIALASVEIVKEKTGEASHLVLTGNYDGNPYRTTVTVDSSALLINLGEILRRCMGETIEEIGAQRVDRNLNLA
jgi:hypothetical protein